MNVVRKASSKAIAIALGRLSRYASKNKWISETNRYRNNTVNNIENDYLGGIRQKALIEYIAASGPLHCADGWSFFSRGVEACERGNPSIAVHLGYYAELRAAMAILATQGIGVFDKRHYIVETPSSCHLINSTTHVFTWAALEFWASLPKSGEDLLKVFHVRGNTLWSWLNAYQPSTTISSTVASSWLKTWGLDLQLLADDQGVRNEASYRPNDIALNPEFDFISSSKLLTDFWNLTEPSVLPFDLLDRHLLKIALHKIFKGANPSTRIRTAQYRGGVRSMLTAIGLSSVEIPKMIGFLERTEVPSLITLAEKKPTKASSVKHLEVLARASLMLRVATGFCARLIADSTLDRSALNFWLDAFGETRGLWAPGAKPANLIDLWDAIKNALIDEQGWIAANSSHSVSLSDWRTGRTGTLAQLAQCECAMLWGLFP